MEKDTRDTRGKLLAAAAQLFAEKGYAAVSVRELAAAAAVNVAAVSYHFASKEGLYQAVLTEQFAPMRQAMEKAAAEAPLPPAGRLAFYAGQIAAAHEQRPYAARFLINELAAPTRHGHAIIQAHIRQMSDFLHTTLREGIAAGVFRPELDVSYAVLALAGIVNFFFITKPLRGPQLPPVCSAADYVRQAFSIYLRGVATPPHHVQETEELP